MINLEKSKNINLNYTAKIVEIKEFIDHPNPKCEKLKVCSIDGYKIVVSRSTSTGIYVYFPVECQLTASYLAANNLFKDRALNIDKDAIPGFFELKGRVKIIRLQGFPSEGLIMPIESLYSWKSKFGNTEPILNLEVGVEFDSVGEHLLCQKYIVEKSTFKLPSTKQTKELKGFDKLIAGQFRFHYDSILLKKCPYVLSPTDIISITEKFHGTSGISSNILCKQKLSWWKKLLSKFMGWNLTDYNDLWASRSVIKNQYINKGVTEGFYGTDIWKLAHDEVKSKLTKGLSLYYEIVGFLPNGGYIQKGYDYGYIVPIEGEAYLYNQHFGIRIYRVTYTNPDGNVYELSAKQVQQWCSTNDLSAVTEYYYGYAKDLYPNLEIADHWHENFLESLCRDKRFYMEELSPSCENKMPHEGVVLKIEDSLSRAYKVKCVKFLEGERTLLDKGEADIENES